MTKRIEEALRPRKKRKSPRGKQSYINGQKSLDDWGSLVETLKGQGTERLEELFNTAYQRALQ